MGEQPTSIKADTLPLHPLLPPTFVRSWVDDWTWFHRPNKRESRIVTTNETTEPCNAIPLHLEEDVRLVPNNALPIT